MNPFADGWAAGWTPDPDYTVSQWADSHRMLGSKSSAEPGKFRTERVPYAREPMDSLSVTDPTEVVVLMWGAQTSKTETGNNWIGYVVHHAPGPMMAVQPTVDMAKRLSKQRLADMIDQTPALRERVAESRSRDSGNTLLSKEFPGGVLVLAGANSASGLRSMPARYLFLDEVDAYPLDVDDEGDPVSLAIKRTTTFGRRRKVLITSTPTVRGSSRVERAFAVSDQRRYFVACPHCGHEQWLCWRGYSDDPGDARANEYRLVWLDPGKTAAGYKCGGEDCGAIIEEHHKTRMLLGGQWRPTAPGDGKTRGYHLSSLYSPLGWKSWVEVLSEFEAVASDPAQLKVFVNTVLAETWEENYSAKLDADSLRSRVEGFTQYQAPAGVLVVTAGIDVQHDRLEIQHVGWGVGEEAWVLGYAVISGDPSDPDTWEQALEAIDTPIAHPSGAELQAVAVAVDEGDGTMTNEVRAFSRANKSRHVLSIKGMPGSRPPIGKPTAVDINIRGDKVPRGAAMYPVGVDGVKSTLYARMKRIERTGPGAFHFCADLPPDYFAQLTAEKQAVKMVNGFAKRYWKKEDQARNEALDTLVYAYAALHYWISRHNRATFWTQMATRLSSNADAMAESRRLADSGAKMPVSALNGGKISLSGWKRGA